MSYLVEAVLFNECLDVFSFRFLLEVFEFLGTHAVHYRLCCVSHELDPYFPRLVLYFGSHDVGRDNMVEAFVTMLASIANVYVLGLLATVGAAEVEEPVF